MSTATKQRENKQERVQVFALWKTKSKKGNTYFTGKAGKVSLKGFFNTDKKNLKEPDLRIYSVDEDGKLSKEEYVSLWVNASKDGKRKYLSGKFDGQRIVGFINEKATEENKHPYVSVYLHKPNKEKAEQTTLNDDAPF